MKKYLTYDEKELLGNLNLIYRSIDDIAEYAAMISQQLDGKRDNLTSDYIRERFSHELSVITEALNSFELEPEEKNVPNIDEKIKGLEELMKEDLY